MDAFYAAVEQLTRPTLRDRPVLVGGLGPRGVVAGASYQARVFGARSAMPMGQARRLCPHAVVLPPRGGLYSAVSEQVMAVLAEAAPIVEPVSLDEAFLEPPALAGATPAEVEEFGTTLRAAVRTRTGLPASVGAGSGKQLAKIASELAKPDGLRVVAPDEEHEVLGPLPVRALWGVGPVAEAALHRLGVRTVGALAGLDLREATDVLGVAIGTELHRLARGIDERPVAPRGAAKQVSAETTFDADLTTMSGRARRRHAHHGRGAPAPGGVGAGGADGHREDPQCRLHDAHPLGDGDPRHDGPRHADRRRPAPGPRRGGRGWGAPDRGVAGGAGRRAPAGLFDETGSAGDAAVGHGDARLPAADVRAAALSTTATPGKCRTAAHPLATAAPGFSLPRPPTARSRPAAPVRRVAERAWRAGDDVHHPEFGTAGSRAPGTGASPCGSRPAAPAPAAPAPSPRTTRPCAPPTRSPASPEPG